MNVRLISMCYFASKNVFDRIIANSKVFNLMKSIYSDNCSGRILSRSYC